MSSKQTNYDVLIYGAGLSSLLLAKYYSQKNLSVCLVDPRDDIGGAYYDDKADADHLQFHSSMELVPDSAEIEGYFEFLEGQIGKSVLGETLEPKVQTFQEGNLRSFVGFGERSFASANLIHTWLGPELRRLKSAPGEWIEHLLGNLGNVEIRNLAKITNIEVEGRKVSKVILDAITEIESQLVIFGENPAELINLFAGKSTLSSRESSALSKFESWTEVSLQMLHKTALTESDDDLFVLYSEKKDFEPCVGRFFLPEQTDSGESSQHSIWRCVIPSHEAEDLEYVGATLRNMKAQIKRVWPDIWEIAPEERIQVIPDAIGKKAGFLTDQTLLKNLDNFCLASQLLSNQMDVVAHLEMSKNVAESPEQDLLFADAHGTQSQTITHP